MKINPTIIERVLDLAVQIQQIPAPTLNEGPRAEFVRNLFLELGAKDVSTDDIGNIYTHLKGDEVKAPIVVSAHLDTVFPPGTDLTNSRSTEKITGPGIGDNSLGLAGLFGLYWAFTEAFDHRNDNKDAYGDLWLVANVGEEGLGDLKGMKAMVDRFGDQPLAYIVLEGMALGQIYHQGLGVRRYRITVQTKGGHSWVDYGNPSAIHELAELVVKIKRISIPIEPRSSLNIGVISGGTSVNSIASEACIELDLRSENRRILNDLIDRVERLVKETDRKGGKDVRVGWEVIGNRPAGGISKDHLLVKTAIKCNASYGIKAKLNVGSTDANEPLSRGLPAICIGLTTGSGAHTISEYIDSKPVLQGMQILAELIHTLYLMNQ